MNEGVVRTADALQSQWLVGVFFLMLVLLAWTNVRAAHKLRLFLTSAVRFSPLIQSARNEIALRDRVFQVMLLVAVLGISVFAFQTGVRSGLVAPELSLFLKITAWIILGLAASVLTIRAIGVVFDGDPKAKAYMYQGLLQVVLLGLLLFPIDLLLTYSQLNREYLIWLGLFLIAAMIIYRWLRGFSFGIGSGIPALYIVLYLCAAEILPALIGLRLLDISSLVG